MGDMQHTPSYTQLLFYIIARRNDTAPRIGLLVYIHTYSQDDAGRINKYSPLVGEGRDWNGGVSSGCVVSGSSGFHPQPDLDGVKIRGNGFFSTRLCYAMQDGDLSISVAFFVSRTVGEGGRTYVRSEEERRLFRSLGFAVVDGFSCMYSGYTL